MDLLTKAKKFINSLPAYLLPTDCDYEHLYFEWEKGEDRVALSLSEKLGWSWCDSNFGYIYDCEQNLTEPSELFFKALEYRIGVK